MREVSKDYSTNYKIVQEAIKKSNKTQRDQECAFQTDEAKHDAQMRIKMEALEAAQSAVEEEEQAFRERQVQYNKERRITTEAKKDSEEHRDALKRKYDANTESLDKKDCKLQLLEAEQPRTFCRSYLNSPILIIPEQSSRKRIKADEGGLQAKVSQSAAPPTLTDNSDQPTISNQGLDELSATNSPSPSPEPLHDDQAIASGTGATTQDGTSEPHSDEHSVQDELSNPSSLQVPSVGNGDRSSRKSQSRPPALTRRTITYDEVYDAARDPQAKNTHRKSHNSIILSLLFPHQAFFPFEKPY